MDRSVLQERNPRRSFLPSHADMRFVLNRVLQPHADADRVDAPATGSTTIAALWRY
jgi:hypothetical protein